MTKKTLVTKEQHKSSSLFTKQFSQGFACALCTIINSHGIETPVVEAWRTNFGRDQTLKSLRALGIDESDIETIKPHLKELNRK